MDELTPKHICEFVKPNFYVMQNIITFLLPGRKNQFDFYTERIAVAKKNLSSGSPDKRIQLFVAWESLQVERIFLTYLLSEEMGTYFEAMARFTGGDITGTVLSKESYTYANNYYQPAKSKSRDLFSRLMMYPFNAKLRQIYNIPKDGDVARLVEKVVNLSCTYLWDKKEQIRDFRKRHATLFNSYKHGMSILYNMKTTFKIGTVNGREVNAIASGPFVLKVKINMQKKARKDQWLQEDLEALDKSVTECFNLLFNLFDIVVRERLTSTLALLDACKYNASSGNYMLYRRPKLSLRFFGLGGCTTDEINQLKKIIDFSKDDYQG